MRIVFFIELSYCGSIDIVLSSRDSSSEFKYFTVRLSNSCVIVLEGMVPSREFGFSAQAL